MRGVFDDNLPNVSTIRKWHSITTAIDSPGICNDSLETLKTIADKFALNGKKLVCSLIFDEMSIRRHVQWSDSEKKFLGGISYGSRADEQRFEVAKNAIVFMVNVINVDITLPVCFHFIRELDATERTDLLKQVLTEIFLLNVRVISITFDGLATNISMCNLLGASFSQDDFRPYFCYPSETQKTYIILDPSHMIKIVRNTIGRNKILYDDENEKIEWKYFEQLENYRKKGYVLTHKLTKKHIEWTRAPMKVILATQTLSNSVANAMTFLKKERKPEFNSCDATVRFIRVFNNIFDMLNTKNFSATKFKSSLVSGNHLELFSYFHKAIKYIKSLRAKSNGVRLWLSKNKTAFRGLIIDLINIESIYYELVGSGSQNALHTFKFSQDPLESFFGRIRSMNGFNDNPNVQQFISAFRKILSSEEIKSSILSNCTDSLKILSISSRKPKCDENMNNCSRFNSSDYMECIEQSDEAMNIDYIENLIQNNQSLENYSIADLAANIEAKIENCKLSGRFSCEKCYHIFSENQKIDFVFNNETNIAPCKSTFEICVLSNQHLKANMFDLQFNYVKLIDSILRGINFVGLYSRTNFENHEHHKFHIALFIAEEYLRVQANYIAKNATLDEQTKILRCKLKKLVHFFGQ